MPREYRLGIIGYGGMAEWHHRNLSQVPEITVHGAYDIVPERQEVAKAAGLHVYDTYEALLADPAIDIVLVACTNNFHAFYSLLALKAGKHVVCEKPVTMNASEMEEVIRVKAETGRHFSVHHNRRWDMDYRIVQQLLAENRLGKPYLISSKVLGSRGIPVGWRTHKEAGGGMLLDWGVHLIDQVIMLLRENVESVYATMHLLPETGVDERFYCEFRFPSGVSARIEVDTNAFVNEPRWILRGEDGSAVVENWDAVGRIVRTKDKTVVWEDEILYTAAGPTKTMAPRTHKSEETLELPVVKTEWAEFYRNFLEVIEGSAEAFVLPEENLYVMQLIDLCFEAARQEAILKPEFRLF